MWCFIPLWHCFLKLSNHLRDCNRHNDWLPCQNINYNTCKTYMIMSSQLYYIHFFHDVKLLLLNLCSSTCELSHALVHFFFQLPYLVIFVYLYDHTPHFLICINFVLLNFLYLNIYMIMCLMYDISVLLYSLYFFVFMYFMINVILHCSSVDHLKPYASH